MLSGGYPYGSYDGAGSSDDRRASAVFFGGPADSRRTAASSVIFQEPTLFPASDRSPRTSFIGNASHCALRASSDRPRRGDASERSKPCSSDSAWVIDPRSRASRVGLIGVAKQQLVEIAKALSKKVRLLILDEPTASLNESDSDALLAKLLEFKAQGISSILISHKLNEIAKVADKITVLRDGATIETLDARGGAVSEDRVIAGMVGRALSDRYPKRTPRIGDILFAVKGWNATHPLHADRQLVKNVSLDVRRGEVVGLAGLMGAGRTEFAMSVFGRAYGQKISGEAFMHGKPVDLSTIRKAIDAGLAYVTEDRKRLGLLLDSSITHNLSLANLKGVAPGGIIDRLREAEVASGYRSRLHIRSSSIAQKVVHLSGGNQQKVVLGKWLFSDPDLLILDEPTRGIDVGAKYEIYAMINELAEAGRGILMISSEMPELLGVCDRIYVMNEGRILGEMAGADASQEKIMQTIMRGGERAA